MQLKSLLRLFSFSSDPGTLNNGDLWYNSTSNTLKARVNSATTTILTGSTGRQTIPFNFAGTVTTGTGTLRWYNRTGQTLTIIGAWIAVGTAPTGATLIADVNKNGTTIFTTQGNRPTISISSNGGAISATPDVTTLADGDYLTIDIDQVGSTVAGADLTGGVVVA